MTDEEYLAHHEAAHAVMDISLGIPVLEVSMIPTEDSEGHVRAAPLSDDIVANVDIDNVVGEDRDRVEERIMSLLAGPVIDKILGREVEGETPDMRGAVDLASRMNGSAKQTGAYLDWLWIRTEESLQIWWVRLEALASALLERRQIPGEEARTIVLHGLSG